LFSLLFSFSPLLTPFSIYRLMKLKLILVFLVIFAASGSAFAQMRAGGTVQGRLLKANGKPLPYTEIELVPVDSNKIVIDTRLNAVSATNGAFSFANVPEGKYTLGINFDDKPSDLSPYGTFFYPATPSRRNAQVFEIVGQSKFTGLIFKLPAALVARKVTGKVFLPDGKPAASAYIAMLDVGYDESVSYGITRTDKNGSFSVIAFEHRTYQLGAILFEKGEDFTSQGALPIAAGESKIFTLDAATPVIQIMMKASPDTKRIKDKYVALATFKKASGYEI
jgi:hypothetical protein